MWGLSREQTRYNWTSTCPNCKKFILPRYQLPDGTPVSMLTAYPKMDRSTRSRCRKCGFTWAVFADQAAPAPVPAAAPARVEIVETSRTEDPLGDDIRRIDNSGSATSVRRLKFSRRWTQRYEVLVDRTESSGFGIDLSPGGLIGLKASTEDAVKRSYGISDESEQTFSEELELTLQPHTAVVLTVHWKQIWQEGVAVVHAPTGVARVPYRAVTGITFDQTSANVR